MPAECHEPERCLIPAAVQRGAGAPEESMHVLRR